MDIEYVSPKPAITFPYTMRTTQMIEHSRGIAWTADLLFNCTRIGTIEQLGRGGADQVSFDHPGDHAQWQADINEAFDGNEENATWWLLEQEESKLP